MSRGLERAAYDLDEYLIFSDMVLSSDRNASTNASPLAVAGIGLALASPSSYTEPWRVRMCAVVEPVGEVPRL